MTETTFPRVKDERGGVLPPLKKSYEILDSRFSDNNEFTEMKNQIKKWVEKLELEYRQYAISLEILKNKKWSLDVNDSKILQKDTINWINTIKNYYNRSPLTTLQENFTITYRNELYPKLEYEEKQDFDDAINSILSELPNPALALLFRFAERFVRRLYNKIMGADPGKRSLGIIIDELSKSNKLDEHVIGYLGYINKYRIDIAHPYKRFSPTESEEFLIQIKKLIEEIEPILRKES